MQRILEYPEDLDLKKINILKHQGIQEIKLIENIRYCIENQCSKEYISRYLTSWNKKLHFKNKITPVFNINNELKYINVIIDNISDNRIIEKELIYRSKLQELVNQISKRFLNHITDSFENEIEKSIEEIGKFAKVDRCNLVLYSKKDRKFYKSYEYLAEGCHSVKQKMESLESDSYPWAFNKLLNEDILLIPDIDELPKEAYRLKELIRSIKINSFIIIPLKHNNDFFGFLGFSSNTKKEWKNENIALLRAVADVFVNAFERKNILSELRTFKTIIDNANYGSIITDLQGKIIYCNQVCQAMHGYNKNELNEKHIEKLFNKNQMTQIENFFINLIDKGSFVTENIWNKKKEWRHFSNVYNRFNNKRLQ